MSLKAPASFGLVKRDQKEIRLKEFIARYLADRACGSSRAEPLSFSLVARSAESPVSRAVLGIGVETGGKQFSVRAIFTTLATADTARIAEACQLADWALQIRWARDVRLMDAHEQLVLDDETSWTGDCMRREPAKHDAFEAFATECGETGRRAKVFFERIWRTSEPVINRRPASGPQPHPVIDAAAVPATGLGEPPPRTTAQ